MVREDAIDKLAMGIGDRHAMPSKHIGGDHRAHEMALACARCSEDRKMLPPHLREDFNGRAFVIGLEAFSENDGG